MAGAVIALFVFTEELGGSGFIAAFVGGLVAGSRLAGERRTALGFTDEEGAVVGAFVFFALGLFAVKLFGQLDWQECVYAILSLTLVHPLSCCRCPLGLRPGCADGRLHWLVRPARPGVGGLALAVSRGSIS